MPQPLPIRGLHHIARTTRDPERSRAFYRDVLGFRDVERPPFDFGGAWLVNYGFQIHLIEHPRVPAERGGSIDTRADHLALAVDDLDDIERRLQAMGIEYRRQTNIGGYQQIFFHDPDGHHVEVGVYPPDPPFVE